MDCELKADMPQTSDLDERNRKVGAMIALIRFVLAVLAMASCQRLERLPGHP